VDRDRATTGNVGKVVCDRVNESGDSDATVGTAHYGRATEQLRIEELQMDFVKMEGLGNDFVVTHHVAAHDVEAVAHHAIGLCDRRRGIGGDGVIFILTSTSADFRMRIFNNDGSEAEMCGNGIRCCAKYIASESLSSKQHLRIETLAGIIETVRLENGMVEVNMGRPRLKTAEIPCTIPLELVVSYPLDVGGVPYKITAVSMGNPHAVLHVDTLSDELVFGVGPHIEKHPFFPNRTNVEFIKVLSSKELQMRVWERGCGETQACGTGTCAAVVAGIVSKLHDTSVTVHLPGGDLHVTWSGNSNDPVMMTGPASEVFRGRVLLPGSV